MPQRVDPVQLFGRVTSTLSDPSRNAELQRYEQEVKGAFDRIVPVLQQLRFSSMSPVSPRWFRPWPSRTGIRLAAADP